MVTVSIWKKVNCNNRRRTQRSQNVTRKLRRMPLFLEKPPLFTVSWKARRSSVQKDGLPSLPGAVDRWVRGAFFELFLGFRFFPVRQRVSAHPPATNASRWALDRFHHAYCHCHAYVQRTATLSKIAKAMTLLIESRWSS